MMKPFNCKVCGKMFLKSISDVCPECIKKEQDLIKNINDYCFTKEEVTIDELSLQFNEPVAKIEKLLLDRKLVQVMDKLNMVCKSCGVNFKIISEGRLYCKTCFQKLENQLGSSDGLIDKPYYK